MRDVADRVAHVDDDLVAERQGGTLPPGVKVRRHRISNLVCVDLAAEHRGQHVLHAELRRAGSHFEVADLDVEHVGRRELAFEGRAQPLDHGLRLRRVDVAQERERALTRQPEDPVLDAQLALEKGQEVREEETSLARCDADDDRCDVVLGSERLGAGEHVAQLAGVVDALLGHDGVHTR